VQIVSKNITEKRFFSNYQRQVAYEAAGGKCQRCGKPLGGEFHAHHMRAHSRGGSTEIDNEQALCPQCNLELGTSGPMPWPFNCPPRDWQERCFEQARHTAKKSFLVQATPAAGKSKMAAALIKAKLEFGLGLRVLVVSPSVNLREAWADDLERFGVPVDPDGSAVKRETTDFVGRSLTYASLTNYGADVERRIQQETATLVILDEIHHASDQAAWGKALRHACELSPFILCLSGTPFRSDGNPIPFITYDANGQAIPDFAYSYADAIKDDPQVCRQVYFPSYEGDMEWVSRDEVHKHSFADDLNEQGECERLRTALRSEDWVLKKLHDANQQLSQIRTNHPDAGGLIVAIDQSHAAWLADLMAVVSTSKPLVITSDDKDAHEKINTFKTSADRWVIAVKMISEGVDIPRLRVCAYLTNIVTPMFFRQVVGRIVRYTPGVAHKESYMFIPADHRLTEMAREMRSERIQAICDLADDSDDDFDDDFDGDHGGGLESLPGNFHPLGAEGREADTITFDGESYTAEEMRIAREHSRSSGVPAEHIAKLLRNQWLAPGMVASNGNKPDTPESEPTYKRVRKQRSDKKVQGMKSELRSRWLSYIDDDRRAYRLINKALNNAVGAKSREPKTEAQRAKIRELLEQAVRSDGAPSWLE
jgi:superfamily II DNA or RNA helicase